MFDIIQFDEDRWFWDEKEISMLIWQHGGDYFSRGYRMPSLALRAHFTPG